MTVYVDLDSDINVGLGSGDSFKKGTETKMQYSEFINKMNANVLGVAMKESKSINELESDFENPTFISDISDIESFELV